MKSTTSHRSVCSSSVNMCEHMRKSNKIQLCVFCGGLRLASVATSPQMYSIQFSECKPNSVCVVSHFIYYCLTKVSVWPSHLACLFASNGTQDTVHIYNNNGDRHDNDTHNANNERNISWNAAFLFASVIVIIGNLMIQICRGSCDNQFIVRCMRLTLLRPGTVTRRYRLTSAR